MFRKEVYTITLSTALTLCPFAAFAASEMEPKDLLNLSLAELSNVEVTSVSKKAEKETEAPAAIYVITHDDIKHSGATNIPDLLRMVPGVTVTQAGAHDWTVTARGGVNQFANKLLVLMDGRTIYSPLFAGVVWDVQDTMLEDIDRIEVIRGPGATLWGANAVNGVINIITKNAKDTQGGFAQASAGNQVKGIGAVRYGTKLADESYVRTYAKQTEYNPEFTATGDSANDNWKKSQAGFRSDSKISDRDTLNIQGDIYTIEEDTNHSIPDITSITGVSPAEGIKAHGGNIMTRWEQKQNSASQTSLQVYFDNAYYKESFFNDEANTLDLDFQHVWTGWTRQEIVWGAGYRFINSRNDPTTPQYSLIPSTRNDNLFNAFLQDKFTLIPESVFLTLGSKFEHNDYTGVEVQPSARLSWLAAKNQTVWASVSRAVHTPSRFTDDGQLAYAVDPTGGFVANPLLVRSEGNRDLDSEELIAYELGYRIQPTKTSSLDFAAFYNNYDKIFIDTYDINNYVVGATDILPVITINGNKAYSEGIEIAGKWNPADNWQLAASYSYINLVFDVKDSPTSADWGRQPKNQFNVRSNYNFGSGITMTNALYYVDQLGGISIPSYYRFDSRLAYEVTKGIEISLVGQNLLDDRHQEFNPFLFRSAAEIGRSVYGRVAIKF
jgi:iron complex outermembrane receptor protein